MFGWRLAGAWQRSPDAPPGRAAGRKAAGDWPCTTIKKEKKKKNPNIRMTRKRTAGQRAGSAGKEQATGSRYGESE